MANSHARPSVARDAGRRKRMNEEHYEGSKDKVYSVNGRAKTFESILARRLQRRSPLAGTAAAVGAIVVNNSLATAQDASPVASPESSPVASPIGVADSLRFAAIEATDGTDWSSPTATQPFRFSRGEIPSFPTHLRSTRPRNPPRHRRYKSATTTTSSGSCHCRWFEYVGPRAVWSSTTSTPIRS